MKWTMLSFLIAICNISNGQSMMQINTGSNDNFTLYTFNYNGPDKPNMNEGFWTALKDGSEVCLNLTNSPKETRGNWQLMFCIPVDEFSSSDAGLLLERPTGSLHLRGRVENWEGMGKYTFQESAKFKNYLQSQISGELDDITMLKLFLGNMTKQYVSDLKSLGYNPTAKDLTKLAATGVDIPYIKSIRDEGYASMDLKMMSKFYIHKITPNYIRGISEAGYTSIEPNMLKKFKIHGVTAKFIQELNKIGLSELDPNMIKKYAIHDISPGFIKSILDLGIQDWKPKDFIKCKLHGINAERVKYAMEQNEESRNLAAYIKYLKHS